MAPRPLTLLALSLTIGALGCGVSKPNEASGVDPTGGAPEVGGGLGQGTGGTGLVGPSGGAGDGAAGGGGGMNVAGSGGLPGHAGVNGTGAGGVIGTAGAGGLAGATGGSVGATGGVPMNGSGGAAAGGSGPGSGGASGPWTNGTCDVPYVIPMTTSHFEMEVGNVDGAGTVDLPCAAGSRVVVLSFDLTETELVYADTLGANWDTVLAFADSCDGTFLTSPADGVTACSDDACGTSQSQAVALLGYGRHYLYLGGPRGKSGVATLHFQHASVGSGPLAALPPGSGTAYGTTQGRGAVNLCQASGAENSYWWKSCPFYAGGTLSASTCNLGTRFDTVLTLQMPGASVVSCADDDPSCGVQSKMSATIPAGAGLYVLTLDGTAGRDQGPYTLTFTRP